MQKEQGSIISGRQGGGNHNDFHLLTSRGHPGVKWNADFGLELTFCVEYCVLRAAKELVLLRY